MPRKTKETDEKKETNKKLSTKTKKASSSAKTPTTKKVTADSKAKKTTSKTTKSTSKVVSTKKATSSTKVATAKKVTTQSKKSTTSKPKSSAKKSSTSNSKKATNSKATSRTTVSKTKAESSKETFFSPEYYDLPFKYNKTVVKILAQTPSNLFIYWEIADEDRDNLKKQYGEYFFEITKPVLIIHNETMNYYFEIDIDDFANSWYLHINDSNCKYQVELGRRPTSINYDYIPQYNVEKQGPISPVKTPYIYISSSNELSTPNDHVLFNNTNKIYFKNIKTNEIIEKDIQDFPFIIKNNKFTNIYELYKFLYKEEFSNNSFDINNPSSGTTSSGTFSSRFK